MAELRLAAAGRPARAANVPECGPVDTTDVAPLVVQCANVPVSKPPLSTQLLLTIRWRNWHPPPLESLLQIDCMANVPVGKVRLLVPLIPPTGFQAHRSADSSPWESVHPAAGY